jgi:hypothetical protein
MGYDQVLRSFDTHQQPQHTYRITSTGNGYDHLSFLAVPALPFPGPFEDRKHLSFFHEKPLSLTETIALDE